MKKTPMLLLIALVALLALGRETRADDWTAGPGFSFKTDKAMDFDEPAGEKWLRWPFRSRSSNRPSALQQLGTGTKRFFARTREWISFAPKSNTAEADAQQGFPSWNRERFPLDTRELEPEETSGGFFRSLFRRSEPAPLRSPHSWIAQERPPF